MRELLDTGTIAWARFVGRRVRRLLPAAILVLVVTAAVTWFVVPGLRRREIGADIAGAALYVVNWVFAHRAVDYLASDARPSPVQHFWSLAVEEQFYVVWPLALIALAYVLRRFGRRPSLRAVGLMLAALAVPSFAYGVWLSALDPDRAYFVTTTRAWELGVGAGLAVWIAARERNRDPATGPPLEGGVLPAAVGWLGLAAVLGTAVWLPSGATTPGPWTLVPTLGVAAVLWAGWTGAGAGPVRVLGTRPMVWIGGLSYSIYLWHWPTVILTEWALDGLSDGLKVGVVVLSVLPAWASHRFLEQPVHHSKALATHTRRAVVVGLALSATGALAALPLLQAPSPFRTTPLAGATPSIDQLGAATLTSPLSTDPSGYVVDDWEWLTPDPQLAGKDRPAADVDRCQVDRLTADPVPCEFGVADGPVTVALVGDSKAMQWLPALERLAPQRGWRIVTYGKSACAFAAGAAEQAGKPYPSCDEFNARVMRALEADPPDLLLTSGYAATAWDGQAATRDALVRGLVQRWGEVADLGVPMAVIGDSPLSPDDLDVCTARHPRKLTLCSFDKATAVEGSGLPAQQLAAYESGTTLIDLTPWICPVVQCPVAIGHVTIHRAGDHLTATYVRTLAGRLGAALDALPPASGTTPPSR
ncbi:SGNH hydrolase domain-containing protein [Pedococcus aerophilus]|uniref:SGNH hydrolase domain-containing protein n=1 Tax=Pedococcus aerophilus TaxID=436356 RepID=A0ABN3UHK9_9MICO